jgi:adenine-specific DNA-methyltransferase
MRKTIENFQHDALPKATAQLFKDLDVPLNIVSDDPAPLHSLLENNFRDDFQHYAGDGYWVGQVDNNAFEGIAGGARELAQIRGKNYDTILVFALEIRRDGERLPTRTQLFDLARAFNREFPGQPVVLIFRYGKHLSLAVVERTDYKVRHLEGDKIGKMSLLRDIEIETGKTHAGHLRILQEMTIPRSGKKAVSTFEGLYSHWKSVLNVSVLNKKFYQELQNWYFWAVHHVQFPGEPTEDEARKNHRAQNVIRLITRLIFSWFLKEKKLIPDTLFDLDDLAGEHLKIASLTPDRSEGSEYYLAILQNLFFATLNQEMGNREFISDKNYQGKNNQYGIKNLFRHADSFKDKDRAFRLFEHIPFLNGGLFECLDEIKSEGEQKIEKIVDGFSTKKSKQPSVPNFLFFQDNTATTDELNEDYGTTGKKYEVRGLIRILNDYKFTIAENTPLEEEVALDPELLGRIFENLLASYNPETKTTARKQTGSFYTPREIVNYMVDESLIAYLKNKLLENHAGHLELGKAQVSLFGELPNKKGQLSIESQPNASRWAGLEIELDNNLRLLFSEKPDQPFTDPLDREGLIAALDACKILDPACGSGAFPMGILHRMVALLHKLDPNNTGWKQRQIQKAEQIDAPEQRQDAIESIERAFQRNELDYARKLFLIENCIFGVDIQPIAVQIAKLRFFISLICDQNVDDRAENRGILALPNLETKFVAANTLIGLENATLAKQAVADLLDERERLHHRMFSAKRSSDKKRFRERDEQLRLAIKEKLDATGWVSGDQSSQLANWNPFDQNASAPFFDPQWMFGIDNGFDVVIGNPPYVDIKQLPPQDVKSYFRTFKTAQNRINLYSIFIEKAYSDLTSSRQGILTFINPNSILMNESYTKIRKLIARDILLLIKLPDSIFENAIVETMILQFQKNSKSAVAKTKFFGRDEILSFSEIDFYENLKSDWLKDPEVKFNIFSQGSEAIILQAIERESTELGELVDFSLGITPYDKYRGHSEESIKNRVFHSDIKLSEEYVPLISGTEIKRFYVAPNAKEFLRYGDWLGAPRERRFFADCKVIVRQIVSNDSLSIIAGYSEDELYFTQIGFSILDKKGNKDFLKFISCLLNTRLLNFYHAKKYLDSEKTVFQKVLIGNCRRFPIKIPASFKLFSNLHDLIQFGIKNGLPPVRTLESVLDGMVCELYFPELMQEKGLDILAQVEQDLTPYAGFEQMSDAEKTASVQRLHLLWTHPDSVVRNRVALMPVRSPEVLGVILEGK